MAEMEWSRSLPKAASPLSRPYRLATRFLDWEDWLTFLLALAAMLTVSISVETEGWSRRMPSLSATGLLALTFSLLLARSSLKVWLAWPLAALTGAVVVFWQTLNLIGEGDLAQRVDAIYFRFHRWFQIAFSSGVSNDSLPFNVLITAVTWLGVFIFGWALFRWHNPWIGLIPGGAALVIVKLAVGASLNASLPLFTLFAFLLIMRTNLTAQMIKWRAKGISYPGLISFSFLNYTFWAIILLILFASLLPARPFPASGLSSPVSTPGQVDAVFNRLEGLGISLAGPLQSKKVVPVHSFTTVMPFQQSFNLGSRELLSVKVEAPVGEGPLMLRGAIYDEYASGGWKAGQREEVILPAGAGQTVQEQVANGSLSGQLVPINIELKAQSIVGSILFSLGEPVSTNLPVSIDVPERSLRSIPLRLGRSSAGMSDSEILGRWTPAGSVGVAVQRDRSGRAVALQAVDGSEGSFPDVAVIRPAKNVDKGESYQVLSLVQTPNIEELRQAGRSYPSRISDQYLQIPDGFPSRVRELAEGVAGAGAPYDQVKNIETYLFGYPLDFGEKDVPPGRDTVDHFLFDAKRGPFDYHASAMVMMLRSVGIPSRLAVGFLIDEGDKDQNTGLYTVRDRNAYSWVEVYFPGSGWRSFDPAGSSLQDTRIIPSAAFPDPTLFLEGFIDPGEVPEVAPSDHAASQTVTDPTAVSAFHWYFVWTPLAVIAFVLALSGSIMVGWRQSVTGLPYAQQVWEKTVRLSIWAGHAPNPGQTPAEFTAQLARKFRGVPDLPFLALVYNRSRFGRRDLSEQDSQRLQRIWPHLRGALLGAIIRRLLIRR